MRITWVTRSFLDYRIPVYKALDELCGNQLTLIYNSDKIPERCNKKIKTILGDRAIPLKNEYSIKSRNASDFQMANVGYSVPYHPDLIKTIRASKPQVIVSDGFLKWTYAALFVRLFNLKRIKHVMCYERTAHTERNAGKLRTLYRKLASRLIDCIDCNGTLTAEYVTNVLGYRKNLSYGHMAADTTGMAENVRNATEADLEVIRNRHNIKGLTFIYVGRLIPLKGIMQMLEAWKQAAIKDSTLMLVGDGEQRGEIENFIRDNNLDNVKLIGAINYDDLGPYYKAADCFIIPTLEDNWSLVVPEAMASGLPIACSIYNGCHPELVHPENGWTFDPLDTNDMVRVLNEISTCRDSLKNMGMESMRIVADHTPKHAAQGIYNACLKLTGNEK